ncbi:glycosyltransferase [Rubripirellula reticaptiva]|uniref:Glycosyltransferase subfamily 4-like N-terminal domain-containing protein n=1 Tax=Rubripirellula reticaptiva TaxID=2528013 RepID=A0A5C6F5U9_9BACT|nr:glycosyltransferase [Rubripirellula reticaptiva]TWU55219.1 hypothetical protein Poly59_15160 [Rubripirellula reticaptiva]
MTLPKLLYVGDVPVECSYHGSALLYRLLEDYPADRLHVIECGIQSEDRRRLVHGSYAYIPYPLQRLRTTRFTTYYLSVLAVYAQYRLKSVVLKTMQNCKPDAILTVGHGFSWIAAAQLAEQLGVPLHFIVHDDVPSTIELSSRAKRFFQVRFSQVYRDAASRLCVSPYMVDEYRERYSASGVVLYPGRSKQVSAITYQEPRPKTTSTLRFAFAGSLNSKGFIDSLNSLCAVLDELSVNAEILMYGPFTSEDAKKSGFQSPRARFRGLVPAAEIVETLQREADILYLPISFSDQDRCNMAIHFPSKLTDYSATGLPVLVFGPVYASAIRWCRDANCGVLTASGDVELLECVKRLSDCETRVKLGRITYEVGRQAFSHTGTSQVLFNQLNRFNNQSESQKKKHLH